MGLRRELAIRAMEATGPLAGDRDFLRSGNIAAPVPLIAGALPAFAREPFSARTLHRQCNRRWSMSSQTRMENSRRS